MPVSDDRSASDVLLDLVVYAPAGLVMAAAEELPRLAARGRQELERQTATAKVLGQFAVKFGHGEIEKRLTRLFPAPTTTSSSTTAPPTVGGKSGGPGSSTGPTPSTGAPPGPGAMRDSGAPSDAGVAASSTGPKPSTGPTPRSPGPTPRSPGPTPRSTGPAPHTTGPAPHTTGPAPHTTGPAPHTTGPAHSSPAEPVRTPAVAPPGRGSFTSTGPTDARRSATDLAIPGYDSLSASQVVQRLDGLDPTELEAVRAYEVSHRARRTVLSKADQLQSGPPGPGGPAS